MRGKIGYKRPTIAVLPQPCSCVLPVDETIEIKFSVTVDWIVATGHADTTVDILLTLDPGLGYYTGQALIDQNITITCLFGLGGALATEFNLPAGAYWSTVTADYPGDGSEGSEIYLEATTQGDFGTHNCTQYILSQSVLTCKPDNGSGILSIPPPPPMTDVLHLNFDGLNGSTVFYDSSANEYPVAAIGDAALTTAKSNTGVSSMYTTNGAAQVTAPTAFFATDDWEIDMWVWADSMSGLQTIFGTIALGGAGLHVIINDGSLEINDGVTPAISYSCDLTTQWNYIKITRSSGIITLYLNNVEAATTNQTPGEGYGYINIGVGAYYDFYFAGYIDDVQVASRPAPPPPEESISWNVIAAKPPATCVCPFAISRPAPAPLILINNAAIIDDDFSVTKLTPFCTCTRTLIFQGSGYAYINGMVEAGTGFTAIEKRGSGTWFFDQAVGNYLYFAGDLRITDGTLILARTNFNSLY